MSLTVVCRLTNGFACVHNVSFVRSLPPFPLVLGERQTETLELVRLGYWYLVTFISGLACRRPPGPTTSSRAAPLSTGYWLLLSQD